jgi:hypothetical protein
VTLALHEIPRGKKKLLEGEVPGCIKTDLNDEILVGKRLTISTCVYDIYYTIHFIRQIANPERSTVNKCEDLKTIDKFDKFLSEQ